MIHEEKDRQDELGEEKNCETDHDDYMTEGICYGVLAGVVLGVAVFDNLGLWLPLGLCLGLAVGAMIKKKK